MGVLKNDEGGLHTLRSQTLVGRSRRSDLPLAELRVSSENTAITWTGESWEIRDLNSRNGTFLNGERLEGAERRTLQEGDRIGFATEDGWTVLSALAPEPVGHGPDGVERRGAHATLLLPEEALPQAAIFRTGTVWVLEQDGEIEPVADGDSVRVGGSSWRLELPTPLASTVDAASVPEEVMLEFRVSLDEEYVEVDLRLPGQRMELGARAHHYMLLTLARGRLQDTDDIPITARGWIHQRDLASSLRVEPAKVNLDVFRARQQIAELGLTDVALIERRRGTGQLRLGIAGISIENI